MCTKRGVCEIAKCLHLYIEAEAFSGMKEFFSQITVEAKTETSLWWPYTRMH